MRLSRHNKFGCPRSVCPLTARHGIQDSGTGSGFTRFPISGGGCGCPGTPGLPRFCSDGGHGSVATLIGSGYDTVRHLLVHGQPFL